MAKLETILQDIINEMDGIFGCAVIDADTRTLLGVAQHKTEFSSSYLEAMAVATVEMIRGKAVKSIESLLSEELNQPLDNTIDDICINAKHTRHFIAVVPQKPNVLVILSTDTHTSVGMGWVVIRRHMPAIAQQCA